MLIPLVELLLSYTKSCHTRYGCSLTLALSQRAREQDFYCPSPRGEGLGLRASSVAFAYGFGVTHHEQPHLFNFINSASQAAGSVLVADGK